MGEKISNLPKINIGEFRTTNELRIIKEKKIGQLYTSVRINIKLTLWSAIKLRIAGIKNVLKEK